MKIYENGSTPDKILNRISIASYFIVVIFSLLGFLFLYMDVFFLLTAILILFGWGKYTRESIIKTYILCSIAISANILRTIFTFYDYHTPSTFIPYYDLANHIWSVIILTYIGIIMVILYYRNKGKYTLFSLSCAFGQLVFLKIFAMYLLLYLSPDGQEYFEDVNLLNLILLITIIICCIGIIILYIANRNKHQLVSIGIIIGAVVLGLIIFLITFILSNYKRITSGSTGYDLYNLLDFSLFSSFVNLIWILFMISLLIYNVRVNRNDLIKDKIRISLKNK